MHKRTTFQDSKPGIFRTPAPSRPTTTSRSFRPLPKPTNPQDRITQKNEAYTAIRPRASAHPGQVRSLRDCSPRRDNGTNDRPTHNRYNADGDLIFSVAKDQHICGWLSHNGERLGTYKGHVGAIWTVDVDPTSTVLASGSADNTIRLWEVKTGRLLKTWEFPTAVKRVEFNEDATKLLGVTEKRMGYMSNIIVINVSIDPEAEQTDEREMTIVCDRSKATVAGWSYMSKYIIAGHEDGSVSQYDGKVSLPLGSRMEMNPKLTRDRPAT